METIFKKPESLRNAEMHYCPGCTHGVVHRQIAEVLDELKLREKTVGVAPVGCSVLAYNYFNCDFVEAAHGRAPAMATGMKRARPDLIIFTYQGDGDLASIGTSEIIHAANRGEKITTVFINNAIYGMTGGQMAPTTMPCQVTTTTPKGRDVALTGYPMRVAELLSTLTTPAYIVRTSVHTPANQIRTKRFLRRAFEYQAGGRCFSFIEVLSTCPTNWGMPADKAGEWLEKNMVPYYPLKVFKLPS